ncbi:MAG TPA: MGMT family protein [Terriglobales bacterium]|nr:MGMT family protein [Terriglobales bacterium]
MRGQANQTITRRRWADALDLGLPVGRASQAAARLRGEAIAAVLHSIPRGRVATYGQVAAAAGYPRHPRAVASQLRASAPDEYPWHRVVGAGGEIKVPGSWASEQRLRLRQEGVTFDGKRVRLRRHQHVFPL